MQKVLVIGLRKQHIQVLQKRFQGRYDIHVVDDQTNHAKKVSNAETYQTILSCTKFTNHKTEKMYRDHQGFIRIAGGRSSVQNFLETEKQTTYRC